MNKKGFTLIELLTVVAILGILVLLAAPKFLGYTEKANLAKIQSGIKAVETAIDLKALDNPELTKDWIVIAPDKLQEINESGKLIDRKGFIKEDLDGGKNIPLRDLDNVKWNSGGEFILSEGGENVYYYNKDMNLSKNPDGSANIPGDNGSGSGEGSGNGNNNGGNETNHPEEPKEPETEEPKEPEITYPIELPNGDFQHEDGKITTPDGAERLPDGSAVYPNGDIKDKDGNLWVKQPDGNLIKPDGSVMLPDKSILIPADASEFKWVSDSYGYDVSGKGNGYYKYTGTKSTVVIPSKIDGYELTSYYKMFENTKVDKVVSYNKKITNMIDMFKQSSSYSEELDLRLLETSNVTDMNGMFSASKQNKINLSRFDTSKVTNMGSMFYNSETVEIDLTGFNTSNVLYMREMFSSSKANKLDLRSFDTSKVTDMTQMFFNTSAKTLNLNSFNTSKVTSMYRMFGYAQADVLDLSSFDISKVTDFQGAFVQVSATVGYAKTESDVNRLNSNADITGKPNTLIFKVK